MPLRLRTDLQPRFSEINDEVARLYATNFSEQELKDILAFYQSPAGKKMLTVQPKVIELEHGLCAGPGRTSFPTKSIVEDTGRNEEERARAVIARPAAGSVQRGK